MYACCTSHFGVAYRGFLLRPSSGKLPSLFHLQQYDMPGPKKAFKSSSQLRKRLKIDKRNAALSSRSDSDGDIKVTCFPRKKILVICNDPDATESSSDEEERVQPKRRVTELFIPVDCPLSVTDSEEELEKDWPLARCCSLSQFSADCSPTVANAELLRPVCSKRTSSKKLPALKKGKGTLNGRKSSQFVGVRRRRQGKWAAEIRDSTKGIRRWLGTYDSAEAAARAYDMAAKKIRGPQFSTNLDSLFVNSLRSSTNSLDDGSVRENPEQDFLLGTPCSESMFEDDQDYNSLVNSPSSVLDNAPSDDSESPNFFAADKVCSDFFNDECPTDSGCSEEISAQENVLVDGQSFEHEAVLETSLTLGSGSSDPRMEGPPFLEAPPFYDTLAPIFDVENDGSGNQRPCLSDPACDEYFTSEDGLGDLPWDLDPEVLAWINIPEACVV